MPSRQWLYPLSAAAFDSSQPLYLLFQAFDLPAQPLLILVVLLGELPQFVYQSLF